MAAPVVAVRAVALVTVGPVMVDRAMVAPVTVAAIRRPKAK
jgi:hypothetical protein